MVAGGAIVAACLVMTARARASPCPAATEFAWTTYAPVLAAEVFPSSPTCVGTGAPKHCAKSLVWVPAYAGVPLPSSAHVKRPLFLFLPGTGGVPGSSRKLLQIAAFAGYRTIGLSYDNLKEVKDQCLDEGRPECRTDWTQECMYEVLNERLTGIDDPDTLEFVAVKDAIAFRLVEALHQAIAWDLADGTDDWDFTFYCTRAGCPITRDPVVDPPWVDQLRWDRIIVSGFSQGGDYVDLLSLEWGVRGAVCLDGGNPRCRTSPTSTALAGFVSTSTGGGASPGTGEFALLHEQHPFEGTVWPEVVPDAFPYVQLSTSVQDIDSAPPPLVGTDVARTDQNWPETSGCSFHTSIVLDACMPTEDSWFEPIRSDVRTGQPWQLHLFPTLVQGFCDAR